VSMCALALLIFWAEPERQRGVDASAPRRRSGPVSALAVTPDGTGYIQGSQAGVVLRSFSNDNEERLASQLQHVHALAFSADGKTLAVAGGTPGEAGVVELWSWPAPKLLGKLEGHDDLVYDVAWLPTTATLVTASADRTVRLWDTKTREVTATLTGHSGTVLALAVAPDGTLLCSGSADHTIRVWDARSGKLLRSLTNHLGPVHSLAFRARKNDEPLTLASAGGDATVRLWQPAVGRMLRIVRHPVAVYAAAWDPDGRLWSGARDGRVRLLGDGETFLREHQASQSWIVSLAVSPLSEQLVVGDSAGQVHLIRAKP